jgi:opacity protein-like surface antigen
MMHNRKNVLGSKRQGDSSLRRSLGRAAAVSALLPQFYLFGLENARSADLSQYIAANQYVWTGLYVGGDAGYRWAEATTALTYRGLVSAAPQGVNGVIGSAIAGWNWEIPNWWNAGTMIVGSELDVIGSSQKEAQLTTIKNETFDVWLRLPLLTTLRGRFGIPFGPGNTWLVYGTAGIGFGRFESSATVVGPVSGSLNGTESRASWVAGGGFEWALSRYWGWKAEYLFLETGAVTNVTPSLARGIALSTGQITEEIFRAGLNYHF